MKKLKDLEDGKILYKSHRAEPYFGFIKDGLKTIEGRIKKGLYTELKVGDEIQVFNNEETESLMALVKDIRNYNSFEDLLNSEDIKKVLPNTDSVEEGVEIYREFYTEDQENEFGVIAIEIELV
ncbi:ASCH domain-containing protein [Patescibacteria group bacterium]|nr:ASCH domain-containing protein [Patescibacteria group bacterium]